MQPLVLLSSILLLLTLMLSGFTANADDNNRKIKSDLESKDCVSKAVASRKVAGAKATKELECTECDPVAGETCNGPVVKCNKNYKEYSCFTFMGKIDNKPGYIEKGCWNNDHICEIKSVSDINGCQEFTQNFEESVYTGEFCFCGQDNCNAQVNAKSRMMRYSYGAAGSLLSCFSIAVLSSMVFIISAVFR